MAAQAATTYLVVPKSQWPNVIRSLEPENVTIYSEGIEILMKPDFDGGWGYFVPRNSRQSPEPAGRFSEVSQGVYWYHPY